MKKVITCFLLIIFLFVSLVGCNNEQISDSSQQLNENTIAKQNDTNNETKNTIVPKSENSNYIANIPKNTPKYVKQDIMTSNYIGYSHSQYFRIFDDSRVIVPIYDDVSSDTVYNNDGTVFIDGNIHNNEFSDKPNALSISEACGNYTIVKSTILKLNDAGNYNAGVDEDINIFLYNIKSREKTEIEDVSFATLHGKYIITDRGIFDIDLNVILPINSEYSYVDIDNDELIIAKNNKSAKYGLLDLEGNIICDFIYSYIYSFNGGGHSNYYYSDYQNFVEYTVATKSFVGEDGYEFAEPVIIDKKGNELEMPFNMAMTIIDGSRFISQYDGKTFFTFCKDEVEYISGVSRLPIAKSANYLVIDENGRIVQNDLSNITGFINGYSVVESKEMMKRQLVNFNGEIIFETNINESEVNDESIGVVDSKGFFVVLENDTSTIYDLAKNKVYSSDNVIQSLGNGFFVEYGYSEEENDMKSVYFSINVIEK